MGLKAQDTCELFFEDVELPADALLGEVDKGFYYLMNELPQVWCDPWCNMWCNMWCNVSCATCRV